MRAGTFLGSVNPKIRYFLDPDSTLNVYGAILSNHWFSRLTGINFMRLR
jgi:hypothetical protein